MPIPDVPFRPLEPHRVTEPISGLPRHTAWVLIRNIRMADRARSLAPQGWIEPRVAGSFSTILVGTLGEVKNKTGSTPDVIIQFGAIGTEWGGIAREASMSSDTAQGPPANE